MGVGVSLKNLMIFIIKNIEMNAHEAKLTSAAVRGGK